MKLLYILTIDEVCYFSKCEHAPRAFADKEEALKALRSVSNSFVTDYNIDDNDEWVIEDNDDSFDAYIDGRWSESHYSASIHEVEVE